MKTEPIWLSLAHMSGGEQPFIQQAFDTNWVVPLGPNVDAFEKDLEEFLNHQRVADQIRNDSNSFITNNCQLSIVNCHIAALASGTAALHLGLILLGV